MKAEYIKYGIRAAMDASLCILYLSGYLKRRVTWLQLAGCMFFCCLAYFAVTAILEGMPFLSSSGSINKIIETIPLLIVFFSSSHMFRTNMRTRLLYSLSLIAIILISRFIGSCLEYTVLSEDILSWIKINDSYGVIEEAYYRLTALVFIFILRLLPVKKGSVTKSYAKGIIVFPLASLFVSIVLMNHTIIAIINWSKSEYYIDCVFALIALFGANCVMMQVISMQIEMTEKDTSLSFVRQNMEDQLLHYKELYEKQRELRRFRHDMKNEILSVAALEESGDSKAAIERLNQMAGRLSATESLYNTGFPVLDAIFDSKHRLAIKSNVDMKLEFFPEAALNVDELDFGIILATALDNAIEASVKVEGEEKRFVSCQVLLRKGNVIFNIVNSTCDTIDINNLRTTKKDVQNHGFGLDTIARLAEKYDGSYEVKYDNYIFTLTVYLDNSYHEKDKKREEVIADSL